MDETDVVDGTKEICPETDSWSRPCSDVLLTVIDSCLPPAKKFEVIRDLCEKIFPQFPEREEIEFPVGIQVYRTNSRLPKYPLWEDPDYPNITQTEMEVICLYLVDSIDLFDVLKYFCEQEHLKFTKSMLESFEDSVYPEIWDYVLDHVEESVDISKYRNFIHSVTDGELRDTIFDCFQKMEKNEWTRDQAKFYFKRIFPKREDLVKRSLYIVLMLYELLHGININEHQKVHFNVTLLNLGDNRPSTKIAGSQVTFDFLVEALNEIITEGITEFPLLNCKIEDLLPDDILPYIVAVQPW